MNDKTTRRLGKGASLGRTGAVALLLVLGAVGCVPGGGPNSTVRCLLPMPASIAETGADCDGNGVISFDESQAFSASEANGTQRQYTRGEFDAADRSKDGTLDLSELRALLGSAYCWAPPSRSCATPAAGTGAAAQSGVGTKPQSGWWEIAPQDPKAVLPNGAETDLKAHDKQLTFQSDGTITSPDSLKRDATPFAVVPVTWGGGKVTFAEGGNQYDFTIVSPTYLKGSGEVARGWSLPMHARYLGDTASDAQASPWPVVSPVPSAAP